MSISRNIKLLTWFNFFTDFKLYAPIAILYFSKISGSYALGTSILSITMISSAALEVPTGILSDFIGRKKTIILGSLAAFLAISFYAAGSSYWILVTGAIFEGLSRSFYSGNNDALLYESLAENGRENKFHNFLGKLSGFSQVGLGVSAFLGSLVSAFSLQAVFYLSAILQLCCFLLSLRLIEPKAKVEISGNVYSHLKDSFKYFIKNPRLRLLSLSSIISFGGEAAYQFRPAFYASIWPIWAIGVATGLNNILGAIGLFVSGRIIDKFGGLKLLILGAVYNRVVSFFAFIFSSIFSPILLATTSFHWGLANTAKGSLMQEEFTDNQRATMASLNSFLGSMFFAVITVIIGIIADRLGPKMALVIMEIFLLGNLYIYWKLFKREK